MLDRQLARAIANSLWRRLRNRYWSEGDSLTPPKVTSKRRNTATRGANGLPKPGVNYYTYSFVGRYESRLGHGFFAFLDRADHDRLMARLPSGAVAEYELARYNATCQQPFT